MLVRPLTEKRAQHGEDARGTALITAARRWAQPDLSLVVVSWNTRELLAQCLSSIRDSLGEDAALDQTAASQPKRGGTSSAPTVEVLVVDNASTDGSADLVREQFPWARLLANTENAGFARGNNQAIPLCRGRYVLLLNPDTEVRPGALEALVRFMDASPQVGAAGSRLLNSDGSLQVSCHPAPTLWREVWRLFHLDAVRPYARYPMGRWDVVAPRRVDVVQGASMIVRREALDQVGLLDEEYFIYSEEVDLCQRLRRSGWQVWWVPASQVVHYGGQSTRQVAAAMFIRLYQGKVLYFRKNHGPLSAQGYKLILLAAALSRLMLTPLTWLERDTRRAQHVTLASHYLRLVGALPSL